MRTLEQIRKGNRERQKKLNDKREAMGLYEVRGIYMPKSKHKAIKLVINNMYKVVSNKNTTTITEWSE